MDNPVGIPRNSTKAQDSQPERREDSKQRVEVTGQLSNQYIRLHLAQLHHKVAAPDQGERGRDAFCNLPGTSSRVPRAPRRGARRLDDTLVAQLAQEYLDGLPVDDLAGRFRVSPATVQKHVRKLGLSRRSPRLGPAHFEEAAQFYGKGESLFTLATRYGVIGIFK